MQKVMPKRKFNVNGKKGKHSKDTSLADADESQNDEEEVIALTESGEADKLAHDDMYTTVDAHA